MLTFEPLSWRRSERRARFALASGSALSRAVSGVLTEFPTCWLLDPFGDGEQLAGSSEDSADRQFDACLGTFIGCVRGVQSVLVEGEPHPGASETPPRFALIEPFVLRWADVEDGLLEASRVLRSDGRAASGVAFLCSQSSAELLLEHRRELSAPQIAMIVRSVRAVLVPMIGPGVMVAFCRDQ